MSLCWMVKAYEKSSERLHIKLRYLMGGRGPSPETLWVSQTNLPKHIKLIKYYVHSPQTYVCLRRNQKSAPSLGTAERYGVATIIGLRNYQGGQG